MTTPPVLVEVVRGGLVESRHRGHVAVVGPDGELLHSLGDPHLAVYPRSSMKPFQAVGMLEAGVGLQGADVALMAASHSGEDFHIEAVRNLLAGVGLDEQALQCPPDLPYDEPMRQKALRAGVESSRVIMNCSGKHAAMLRTCVVNGWSTDDYLDPAHPLQVHLKAVAERLVGGPVLAATADGCGAPLWAVPLSGLARAMAVLANASPEEPAGQVADAFRQHPEFSGGTLRDITALNRGIPGMVAKDGAEGVQVMGLPDGRAVALKIEDGSNRGRTTAAAGVLATLGLQAEVLDQQQAIPVLGGGQPTGVIRPGEALADLLG